MKNIFLLIAITSFITSCSTLKPTNSSSSTNSTPQKQSSLQFIDNVSINGDNKKNPETVATNNTYKRTATYRPSAHISHNSAIENYSSLQFKYAILEDASVEEMQNEKLLDFMEEWYGTKYHFGGSDKEGIDCSAFVSTLMSNVYGISNLPRMSKDQYIATPRVKKNNLHEGDLVFFHTYGRKKTVTHVGVYLRNNKFVHASVSGVMISDMSDGYYSTHFVGAGRVLDASARDAAAN
ncbi:MAG TPA: NlpC/P60 family protein [Puia sp.]|nr:NlpC/P60 family protein [Puia sp.]